MAEEQLTFVMNSPALECRRDEARTEGFDTADLKDAKALLDELSS